MGAFLAGGCRIALSAENLAGWGYMAKEGGATGV
jgi:hypothetical protein